MYIGDYMYASYIVTIYCIFDIRNRYIFGIVHYSVPVKCTKFKLSKSTISSIFTIRIFEYYICIRNLLLVVLKVLDL